MDAKQEAEFNWRVTNWARWASGGQGCGGSGRCGSAEGRFIRELLPEEERERLATHEKVDVDDAQIVEDALCSRDEYGNPRMYLGYRQVLVLWYVKRWSKEHIAREVGVELPLLNSYRECALRRLSDILPSFDRKPERKTTKRRDPNRLVRVASAPTTSRVSATEH